MFSSTLPVAGINEERKRKTQQINTWIQDWCHQQNSGSLDHKLVYMTPDLLATEGVHLSQKGKRIFA